MAHVHLVKTFIESIRVIVSVQSTVLFLLLQDNPANFFATA